MSFSVMVPATMESPRRASHMNGSSPVTTVHGFKPDTPASVGHAEDAGEEEAALAMSPLPPPLTSPSAVVVEDAEKKPLPLPLEDRGPEPLPLESLSFKLRALSRKDESRPEPDRRGVAVAGPSVGEAGPSYLRESPAPAPVPPPDLSPPFLSEIFGLHVPTWDCER